MLRMGSNRMSLKASLANQPSSRNQKVMLAHSGVAADDHCYQLVDSNYKGKDDNYIVLIVIITH